ncbi:MAG TPA: hypothetical protein VF165_04955 [Nocardioidaceae bacterium]
MSTGPVTLGDLTASDWLFIVLYQVWAIFLRWRFTQERGEMRKRVRVVGQFATIILVAAPTLMIIGALTGRLETNGP